MAKKIEERHSFAIEGLSHALEGKIIQTNEVEHLPYELVVSHFCKPFDGAVNVHKPSRTHTETIEQARSEFESYASHFKVIGVESNPNF
ncbi:hypothetical protein CHH28_10330 [Bacterioplanes sanyensis]|uniref:Uncharacterized protein n=1 Tax=Bacterioplanes sanyensis TaxID=1249553 RepID=A0A222FJU5_9GAMM|nr:hypothetical protein [Bacterioplanes sanyensis]ASP39050.1 hypothetical protein CHH28_10330 [Bacterioplanes sanyensis]